VSVSPTGRALPPGPYGDAVQVAYRSEIGHVRTRNEDAVLARAERGVFAVADGLGGHPAWPAPAGLPPVRRVSATPGKTRAFPAS